MNGPQKSADRSVRILLAEDNEINQRVVMGMLERQGYEVHAVYNGLQALEALESGDYDLVIMDCLMPVMDGCTATREIRASRSGRFDPQIPVLAITALAAPGDREKCFASGMSGYISKPVMAKALFDGVQLMLGRSAGQAAVTDQDPQGTLAGILRSMSDRLLADFADWRADLARLTEQGALKELRHLAHSIRGTADLLGDMQLSAAAAELEAAAAEKRTEPLEGLAAEVIAELQRLERSMQKPS